MKRDYILGVLFFSGLWGLSEAFLGGALYSAHIPGSSIILTVIAFGILAISRSYLPQKGTATLMGLFAMLFKFFNSPFFACHFAAIAIAGISFDLFFSILNVKNKAIAGFAAAFFSYTAFAVFMTFIVRYSPYWTESMAKFNGHIIRGIIAAAVCTVFVPIMLRAGQSLKVKVDKPFSFKWKAAQGTISVATAGLWVFSLCVFSLHWFNASR